MQQSPWLSIANKQLELMGRYMGELGLTPSARTRLPAGTQSDREPLVVFRTVIYEDRDGHRVETPPQPAGRTRIALNGDVAGKL